MIVIAHSPSIKAGKSAASLRIVISGSEIFPQAPADFPLYLIGQSGSHAVAGRQWPIKTLTLLSPGGREFLTLHDHRDFVD